MRLRDHAGKYVRRQGDVTGIGEQVIIMGSKKSPVTCARNVTALWEGYHRNGGGLVAESGLVHQVAGTLGKVPALAADIGEDREK